MQKQLVKISDLKNNNGQINGLPKNPRILKDDKFKKLVKSLQDDPEMLELRELIAYDNNGELIVICGNMRLRAMKELKIKQAHVKILPKETTIDKLKAYTIKDNVAFGEHDWDVLANEWNESELTEWGLDLPVNFETQLEAEEDDFAAPEGGIETDIVLGDLFEIGEHRLLCGDSTDSDQVAKLMNGQKPDMVFTDPPYGISHSGKGIKGATKENNFGEILNDGDVSVAIDFFNLCQSEFNEATLIFWGANYYSSCIPNGFGWLVWDKEREGNTFSGAEIAFVNKGVKVDVFKHQWHGMIKASEMGEKRVHPTQKPIALVEWCFNNYKAGDLILDGFLGSGSTMVAAHQLKRKCYGMELDPKYCQVIIDRMKKLDPSLVIKRNGVELK